MSLSANFRYAGRQLRKRPSLTITVLATLGLCIGANTAVFTIVDALFFRPPPYPAPQRLAVISTVQRAAEASDVDTSQNGRQWELVRDHATTVDAAVFGGVAGINLFANNHAEYVNNERVSANFFHVLGVAPLVGREFTRPEDVPNGPPLVVLSFSLWKRLFDGNRHIIGRTIELGGEPHTVVGVMPAGFVAPSHDISGNAARIDVWTPLHPTTTGEGGGDNYEVIARLRPGVTFAAADGQLNAIMHQYFEQQKAPGVHFEEQAMPLQAGETYDIRRSVRLMWGAVGIVLLIGCVNIAGLLLARAHSRSREIATRLALGATRTNIIGELLAECILLALGGGFIGIMIGHYALQALIGLNPGAFETWGSVTLDAPIMLVMLAVSLATSVLFGLFPALETTSVDLRSALSEAGRNTAGSRRQWKRQALVFAEVTLGVVLVVSAGLLIRTFATLVGSDPGFDPHHLIVASASLEDARYKTAHKGARLFQESVDRMEQIPGVESAAVALSPPYGRPVNDCITAVNGVELGHHFCGVAFTYATPGMFHTLRMHVLRGSVFRASDTANTAPVTVVNKAFVREYLKNSRDPVGSIIKTSGKDWRIVGVVSDVQQKSGWGGKWGPIDAFPQMYVPASQVPDDLFAIANVWFSPVWMVRTRADVPGLPDAMRHALTAIDPRLPFSSFHSMEAVAGASVQEQRYHATLFSVLAGLGTLLAAIGVYGLIAESVAQRTREMGIRLALGATLSGIVRHAAAPGIMLSIGGVGTGLILAFFVTRLLRSMIWGVKAGDPVTFATVALLLIAVASVASLIPAMRLARIDPAQTLRDE
ncbi:MAG: ABC transporter permease [Acidobacteriaceae bacterium]|nr:ABC transporter permease [Acidobacteriaceae bacterium]